MKRNAMRALCLGWIVVAFGSAAILPSPSLAQTPPAATTTPDPNHPGKAIYDRACALCHANPAGTRAATFSQITGTSAADLRTILAQGAMKPMAAGLSPDEITTLIGYLTSFPGTTTSDAIIALGGVRWGVASDDRQVFAAVADSIPSTDAPKVSKPGVYAFRLSDGKPMYGLIALKPKT